MQRWLDPPIFKIETSEHLRNESGKIFYVLQAEHLLKDFPF